MTQSHLRYGYKSCSIDFLWGDTTTQQYFVHFILCYGTLVDIRWLLHRYMQEKVEAIFIGYPMKIYSKQTFLFIKNFILDLHDISIDESRYVAFTWQRYPGKFGPPPKRI